METPREVLDEDLFCAVKKSLLIIILSSQLRQGEAGVLTEARIEENLPRILFGGLHKGTEKFLFFSHLQEFLLVLYSFKIHVLPFKVSKIYVIDRST